MSGNNSPVGNSSPAGNSPVSSRRNSGARDEGFIGRHRHHNEDVNANLPPTYHEAMNDMYENDGQSNEDDREVSEEAQERLVEGSEKSQDADEDPEGQPSVVRRRDNDEEELKGATGPSKAIESKIDSKERMSQEKIRKLISDMRRECSMANEEDADELEMMNVGEDGTDSPADDAAASGVAENGPDLKRDRNHDNEATDGSQLSLQDVSVDVVNQLDGDSNTAAARRRSYAEALAPDSHSVEQGGKASPEHQRREDYECTSCPFLTPFLAPLHRASNTKKLLVAIGVMVGLGLLLFVSLFPASFIYIEYDKIAFSRNKLTGAIDYSEVYQSGCYLLAPQDEIVTFNATAHFLTLDLSVMNSAGLSIGLQVMMQYFIRPDELAALYQKYHTDYTSVIHRVAESTVKNLAIKFSMDEYRLERSKVEAGIFEQMKFALSGDCCPSCCPQCRDSEIKCGVDDCKMQNCSQGYHVDLRYLQMGQVTIPDDVMNRYMQQIILKIETERELYYQERAVKSTITSLEVQKELNAAKEIREMAEAKGHVIRTIADATKYRDVQIARVMALRTFFLHNNITQEEERTAFIYMKALMDARENLYVFSYNFDSNSAMSP